MKIGFIQKHNETQRMIYSTHPDFYTIPEYQREVMPEWVGLPDAYEYLPGINLINIETGEITNIPPDIAPPQAPSLDAVLTAILDNQAQIQQDQLTTMKALAEIGGMLP